MREVKYITFDIIYIASIVLMMFFFVPVCVLFFFDLFFINMRSFRREGAL